ncbi:MAG: hypothetical protein HFK04_02875 [Oscillospiraceae bacterium]|nr:hypothetical protein [Oscillospiraceae bacterium]
MMISLRKSRKTRPFLEEKGRVFTFRNTLENHSVFPHFSHCFQQSTRAGQEFSTKKAGKTRKLALFPTNKGIALWKLWWIEWKSGQKKSQATGLRKNEKRKIDDKGGGIDRKQYNTVSCHLL